MMKRVWSFLDRTLTLMEIMLVALLSACTLTLAGSLAPFVIYSASTDPTWGTMILAAVTSAIGYIGVSSFSTLVCLWKEVGPVVTDTWAGLNSPTKSSDE